MNGIYKLTIVLRLICFFFCFLFGTTMSYAQMNGGGFGGGRVGGGHRGIERGGSSQDNYYSEKKIALGDHGGEIKEVGKYKVEMVFDPLMKENPLIFYFATRKGKIINNSEVKGVVEISAQDNTPTYKESLVPVGNETFSAQINNKTVPFLCKVSFVIDGHDYSESFYNKGFAIKRKENIQ